MSDNLADKFADLATKLANAAKAIGSPPPATSSLPRSVSDAGIEFIKKNEGVRLSAYQDTRGIWTIGVGHVGPEAYAGATITDQQCSDLLRKDLHTVDSCLSTQVKVPLTQNQYDSLADFIFNVGIGAFSSSTMLKLLNSKDYVGASDQFHKWEKQKELAGRRERERLLFLKP